MRPSSPHANPPPVQQKQPRGLSGQFHLQHRRRWTAPARLAQVSRRPPSRPPARPARCASLTCRPVLCSLRGPRGRKSSRRRRRRRPRRRRRRRRRRPSCPEAARSHPGWRGPADASSPNFAATCRRSPKAAMEGKGRWRGRAGGRLRASGVAVAKAPQCSGSREVDVCLARLGRAHCSSGRAGLPPQRASERESEEGAFLFSTIQRWVVIWPSGRGRPWTVLHQGCRCGVPRLPWGGRGLFKVLAGQ